MAMLTMYDEDIEKVFNKLHSINNYESIPEIIPKLPKDITKNSWAFENQKIEFEKHKRKRMQKSKRPINFKEKKEIQFVGLEESFELFQNEEFKKDNKK